MEIQSDRELVISVQNGHISAFATLVKKYERPLVSFLLRYMGNIPDAEEVAQDAFLSVYRSISRIDPDRKFSSYLFTVAKNNAVSRLRSKKLTIPLTDDVVDEDQTLYERLATAEEREKIMQSLHSIDRKYADALRLYYFDDLSYEEIAGQLHIPLNTVRIRLMRGKKLFRRIYEKTT